MLTFVTLLVTGEEGTTWGRLRKGVNRLGVDEVLMEEEQRLAMPKGRKRRGMCCRAERSPRCFPSPRAKV